MDCNSAIERLPWLLNGTLQDPGAYELREHLATCAACRLEFERTGWVWEVHRGAHLPAETLVAIAAGEQLGTALTEAASDHLATCVECTRYVALAREGRAEIDSPSTPTGFLPSGSSPADTSPPETPPSPYWRWAAIAASIVGIVGLGSWANQQARSRALIEQLTVLEQRLSRLEIPELNVPLFEVSAAHVVRGEDAPPTEIELPAGARSVTLILLPADLTPGVGSSDGTVRLLDSGGSELWSQPGLRRSELGDFTLSIPTGTLPDGRCSLEVTVSGTSAGPERYPIEVVRKP